MSTRLQGRSVLITGASSGIGEALARELASRGARLILAARRKERLETLASELRTRGSECHSITCDVNAPEQIEHAVATTLKQNGQLDILIANAGFGVVGPFENLTVADYRRQFETNVFGLLNTAKAGLDALKKSRGTLVLLGSVASYVSLPGNTPYSMSKFAVRALAEGLEAELKPHGVAVVLITPGFVESEIRRVDNQGVLHEQGADPVSAWLQMPAPTAARIIARAIERRKREQIVTVHGHVAVFIQRHLPAVFRALTRFGIRSRREPGKQN